MEDRNIVVRIGNKEFNLGAKDLDTQREYVGYLIHNRRNEGISGDESAQYDGVMEMYDAFFQAAGLEQNGIHLNDVNAMKDIQTTLRDWQDAIGCQNACNASGLLNSLFEMMPRLWHDVRHGLVDDHFSQHPVLQMFLAQIYLLCTGEYMESAHYGKAYNACKAKIAELEAQKQ